MQSVVTFLAVTAAVVQAEFLPLGIKEAAETKEHHHEKESKGGFSLFKKEHHHHSHKPPWEHAHKMTPPSDLERKHREGMIPSVREVSGSVWNPRHPR